MATFKPAWTPRRLLQPRYGVFALLAFVTVVSAVNSTSFTPGITDRAWGDGAYYLQLSQHAFADVPNPFALRLLVPLMVHGLAWASALGPISAWFLVTVAATVAVLIVFFKLLHDQLRLSIFTSTWASLLLAFSYTYVLFNLSALFLVDPVANLLVLGMIWFALQRQLAWYMAVALVGCFVKESVLAFVPLYVLLVIWQDGWRGWRTLRRELVAAGVVVVVYAGFRIWWPGFSGNTHSFGLGSGQNGQSVLSNIRWALNSRKDREWQVIWEAARWWWVAAGFGVWQWVRRHGWRDEWLLISGYGIVMALAGRLVATDAERLYGLAIPFVLVWAARWLDQFRNDWQRAWLVALGLLYAALNLGGLAAGQALAADAAALILLIWLFIPHHDPPT